MLTLLRGEYREKIKTTRRISNSFSLHTRNGAVWQEVDLLAPDWLRAITPKIYNWRAKGENRKMQLPLITAIEAVIWLPNHQAQNGICHCISSELLLILGGKTDRIDRDISSARLLLRTNITSVHFFWLHEELSWLLNCITWSQEKQQSNVGN